MNRHLPSADPFPGPWQRVSWGTQDGRVIHRVDALSLNGKPNVVCYVDTAEQAEAIVASKAYDTGLLEVEAVLERMERLRQDLLDSQERMRKHFHEEIAMYSKALESARAKVAELEGRPNSSS